MYANINRGTWDRTPTGFARNAQAATAEGFTAIKCAPFDNVSAKGLSNQAQHAATAIGIDRIREIRAAIGPDVDLMVDCHSRFGTATAIQMARELDDVGLTWLEDPVSLQDLEQLRQVNEHTSMPIATGERFRTLTGFRTLLESRVAEYILPDVKYVGGILGIKKIAALAEAFGVLVAPHNPSGPVASAASIHCMATVPNFGILEYAWGEVDWRRDLIDPSEQVEDGFAPVPVQPGLGVSLGERSEAMKG